MADLPAVLSAAPPALPEQDESNLHAIFKERRKMKPGNLVQLVMMEREMTDNQWQAVSAGMRIAFLELYLDRALTVIADKEKADG